MTIIEKIRAEVERRIKNNIEQGLSERADSLDSLLPFLSDLEKECEEIPNDLEEASQEYEKKHTHQRYDGGGFTPEYDATLAEAVIFGAKWQKEQDLGKISRAYENGATFGMRLQKERMMKEAVEGEVIIAGNDGYSPHADVKLPNTPYFHLGRKVKVIVIKEEQ